MLVRGVFAVEQERLNSERNEAHAPQNHEPLLPPMLRVLIIPGLEHHSAIAKHDGASEPSAVNGTNNLQPLALVVGHRTQQTLAQGDLFFRVENLTQQPFGPADVIEQDDEESSREQRQDPVGPVAREVLHEHDGSYDGEQGRSVAGNGNVVETRGIRRLIILWLGLRGGILLRGSGF